MSLFHTIKKNPEYVLDWFKTKYKNVEFIEGTGLLDPFEVAFIASRNLKFIKLDNKN